MRRAQLVEFLGLRAAALTASVTPTGAATASATGAVIALFAIRGFTVGVIGIVRIGIVVRRFVGLVRVVTVEALLDHTAVDRGDFVLFRRVDLDHAAVIVEIIVVMPFFVMPVVVESDFAAFGAGVFLGFLGGAKRGFFGRVLGFFGQQCVTILLGDLVVVGVNFAERQEPVAVATEVDERGLERWFDPGYFGEVDIALDLLMISGLEIKFLDAVAF